ncbi:Flp pilus assembly protein CpaB [Marinomonas sp. 2405UD66-6]|uniref:Flp pilus assembly protein CpaB n=1 Tax=Marinomonas sp. 2405UD66-6 TaxID=3391834 RepID=UPI0039C8D0D8
MKSKVLMVVSLLLLGVGLSGLIMSRFSTAPPVVVVPEKKEITYEVWVTRHSLALGDPVTRNDLYLKIIPQEEALKKGIQDDVNLSFTAGMVVNTPLAEGELIVPENITKPNQDGYFRLVMTPGNVPFPVTVSPEAIVGGVIKSGSKVDVLALTSLSQNLASEDRIRDLEGISLAPILMGVNVLQVKEEKAAVVSAKQEGQTTASLILELTPKQVATLTVAKHIAELEVHVSTGVTTSSDDLSANAGDVIPRYTGIREFRPDTETLEH